MKSYRIFLMALLFTNLISSKNITKLSDAIQTAREQEILLKQIVKNYIMIGMNNNFNNPAKTMEISIKSFEENMQALDDFAASKEAFENSEKVSKQWNRFIKMAKGKKELELSKKLVYEMTILSPLCRDTTKLYTRQTGIALGEMLDATANLETISQKMAILYMLKSWGMQDKRIAQHMKISIELFEKSIKILEKYKDNTAEIKKIILAMQKDFLYFKVLDQLGSSAMPTLIYRKSNLILKDAREISRLYSNAIILN